MKPFYVLGNSLREERYRRLTATLKQLHNKNILSHTKETAQILKKIQRKRKKYNNTCQIMNSKKTLKREILRKRSNLFKDT